MSSRTPGRLQRVDGIFLLNKPAGMTSNRALQQVKRLLRAKKAGHTGSLDPAATGMLPLCFGEATKVCAFLLDADKTYRVTAKLGQRTNTGDADGDVTETAPVPHKSAADWQALLDTFLGQSEQVPPMYSALKKDGRRLYELARKGEEVERAPRSIRIDRIELLEAASSRLVFCVRCSKGTYVRSLVEDIAAAAGTLAFTASLHRVSVAGFDAEPMLDMPASDVDAHELAGRLMPADKVLTGMPALVVDEQGAEAFQQGRQVAGGGATEGVMVRLYGPGGDEDFLGVGEVVSGGRIAPKRVFARRK